MTVRAAARTTAWSAGREGAEAALRLDHAQRSGTNWLAMDRTTIDQEQDAESPARSARPR